MRLREFGDAFEHARAHAGELGAGTLVSTGRFGMAEFAVVLEPELPLAAARPAFYAGMVALWNALAAIAPPQKPITIEWPGTIRVDGALVGGGRLGWPDDAEERGVPAWLVFGAAIRTAFVASAAPGRFPAAGALEEEGFELAAADGLLEGFARRLLAITHRCEETGFSAVAAEYLSRLDPAEHGDREIGPSGELILKHPGTPARIRELAPALLTPSWLDPSTSEPRLRD